MTTIDSLAALRGLYAAPTERVVRKQIAALDAHCRRFIATSPFLVLATTSAAHETDASPRGGEPGWVRVTEDGALLLADSPGNNRLDSLQNIVETGKVGLLFMIPGIDETLRVNGQAVLSTDPADIAACATERRAPKLVIRVTVAAAYLHCATAFMRSRLWEADARVDRDALPPPGRVLNDHTGVPMPEESREAMLRRYAADL
jgi:PPOX class probable FMN-dependent enzyme